MMRPVLLSFVFACAFGEKEAEGFVPMIPIPLAPVLVVKEAKVQPYIPPSEDVCGLGVDKDQFVLGIADTDDPSEPGIYSCQDLCQEVYSTRCVPEAQEDLDLSPIKCQCVAQATNKLVPPVISFEPNANGCIVTLQQSGYNSLFPEAGFGCFGFAGSGKICICNKPE